MLQVNWLIKLLNILKVAQVIPSGIKRARLSQAAPVSTGTVWVLLHHSLLQLGQQWSNTKLDIVVTLILNPLILYTLSREVGVCGVTASIKTHKTQCTRPLVSTSSEIGHSASGHVLFTQYFLKVSLKSAIDQLVSADCHHYIGPAHISASDQREINQHQELFESHHSRYSIKNILKVYWYHSFAYQKVIHPIPIIHLQLF